MAGSKAIYENTPVIKAVNRSLPGFEHGKVHDILNTIDRVLLINSQTLKANGMGHFILFKQLTHNWDLLIVTY